MMRIYKAGSRASADSPAAKALRSRLAAMKQAPAKTAPKPATDNSPAKPKAKAWTPPKTEAEKAGFMAANARIQAVMNHPAFAQHTNLAVMLLANEKLSAAELGNLLDLVAADTPAKQDAALADMRAELNKFKALHGGAAPAQSNSASAIWDRAIARVAAETSQEVAQ